MPLNIPLDGLGGEDAAPSQAKPAFRTDPLDEIMSRVFEVERGILVEFSSKKAAEAQRFRFYRRISYLRKHGIHSFDRLVFTIEGTSLKITCLPDISNQIKEL